MIEIRQLSKSFGKFRALNDISLSLKGHQAISLLGSNGSGKTTLIKSILGLVIPESGSISVNGKEVKHGYSYRADIGFMPQIGRYPDNMTIGQVINMVREMRTDVTAYDEDLIRDFGIEGLKNKIMRTLSGGTRQKVSACLAFLFNPGILILDEPTAGLDPLSSEILRAKISKEREKGKLILITSHVLSDLDGLASEVIYLQDGKLMFHRHVHDILESAGEEKLTNAVAKLMRSVSHDGEEK